MRTPPELLTDLTLEEKASLCSGADFWRTTAVDRLGIPAIMVADGPNGLRKQPEKGDHMGLGGSNPATCFPPAAGLGSSWNVELAQRVGMALGAEAAAEKIAVVLGPGINIKRSPLCGRNFEYLSEDPRLSGELGAAYVTGVQSNGVGTSLKHFAVNNQETERLRVSAEVDERTLREIYLAGFERVIAQAAPWTVMCSYNRINGVYASQDPWLLTEILRDEWGFEGAVVSDWGAVNDRVAGLAAGLDLEMPASDGTSDAAIVAAVQTGVLEEIVLDRAVLRLLELIERAQPMLAQLHTVDHGAHHELARAVATECVVLLKNDKGLLPLAPDTSVAVIGEFARTPRYQGTGSAQVVPTQLDNALDAIQAIVANPVSFAAGYVIDAPTVTDASTTAGLLSDAVAVASAADTVLLFLGLPSSYESEGWDRDHMSLPPEQLDLLEEVVQANPQTIVVLSNGSAVTMSDWADKVPAIMEAWLLGQAGGAATADLIFGRANPSGRLAETIPLRLEDNPSFGNFPGDNLSVRYGEGLLVGYRHYDTRRMEVSYPFGHGLSYTTFEYAALTTKATDEGVAVSVEVTNTGSLAGQEVVQVYLSDPHAAVFRPLQELVGFTKVALDPGASTVVEFALNQRDLSIFHPTLGRWVVQQRAIYVEVGASSRDIRLRSTVQVAGESLTLPLGPDSTLEEWSADPAGSALLQEAFGGGGGALAGDAEIVKLLGNFPLVRLARFGNTPFTTADVDRWLAQLAN
jgi:beta-glucosidase